MRVSVKERERERVKKRAPLASGFTYALVSLAARGVACCKDRSMSDINLALIRSKFSAT